MSTQLTSSDLFIDSEALRALFLTGCRRCIFKNHDAKVICLVCSTTYSNLEKANWVHAPVENCRGVDGQSHNN